MLFIETNSKGKCLNRVSQQLGLRVTCELKIGIDY